MKESGCPKGEKEGESYFCESLYIINKENKVLLHKDKDGEVLMVCGALGPIDGLDGEMETSPDEFYPDEYMYDDEFEP